MSEKIACGYVSMCNDHPEKCNICKNNKAKSCFEQK